MRVVLLAITIASSGCVPGWDWPKGARVRIEMDNPTHTTAPAWRDIVLLAIDLWTEQLGEDCPFPYELDPNGDHVIRLIGVDSWPHGTKAGMAFDDRIEIIDGLYDVRMLAVVEHELGHAFGLGHAPKGSRELMAPSTEVNFITENDRARAREALDCEAP